MKKTFILVFLLAVAILGVESQRLPGEPKRIIDFPTEKGEPCIKVHESELKSISGHDEIKDRKIVAVSIVGPFRKGKSFLLDYFLKYLYFTYKSVSTLKQSGSRSRSSGGEWIGLPDEPLTGFSWKKGVDRHTSGIVLWSDVFLYDNKITGEKLAIILIDTQGLFDHKTPQEINGKIFSFTTLMSSIQIFNLPNIIHENELEYLQFATEYAKFSISDESPGKPFEHLLFLIRDWENEEEYEFGFEGGSRYLDNKVLSVSAEQKTGMMEMRMFIKDSYDEISCFLLPHPGDAVRKANYDGRWSKLSEEFVEQLKTLVPGLLSPENLKAKKTNGHDTTVSKYLMNLKVYESLFANAAIPSAKTVFESSVALYMDQVVKKFVSLYNAKITEQMDNLDSYLKFDVIHLKGKEKVLNEYLKEKKMGNAKHDKFYQNKLIESIDNAYIELNKTASIQIDKKRLENEKKALQDAAFKAKLEREKEEQQRKLAEAKEREWKQMLAEKDKLLYAQLEEHRAEMKKLNDQLEKMNSGSAPRASNSIYFIATILVAISYFRMK